MFQLLALNPPSVGRSRKIRGVKSPKRRTKARGASRSRRRSASMPRTRMPRNSKGRFVKRAYSRKRRRANKAGVVFSGKKKWGSRLYKGGPKVPVYRPRIKLVRVHRSKRRARGIGFLRATGADSRARGKRARIQRLRFAAIRRGRGQRVFYNNPGTKRRRRRRKAHVAGVAPVRRRRRRSHAKRRRAHAARPIRRRRRRAHAAHPVRRRRRRSHAKHARRHGRRRAHARRRRHANPGHKIRRRRHHARRHSNPFGFHLPKIFGVDLNQPVDFCIDGAIAGAGLAAAFALPKTIVSFVPAQYGWINTGYYGVGLSAASTMLVASLGSRFVSPRIGKLLALGGGLATVVRLLANLAPVQVNNYITAPMQGDVNAGLFASGAGAMQGAGASGKAAAGYGDSPFFSAADIVRGERGIRDWVQTPSLPSTGVRDWVDMTVTGNSSKTGAESF